VPIPRTLSWTGWLLVLVYLGGLTAVSTFVVHKLFDMEELLFYEVFLEVLLITAIIYILSSVHNSLENRNWNEKRTNIFIRVLAVVFAIIGATYMLFGLGQYISLVLYPNDPTFNELELDEQEQTIQEAHLFAVAFIACSVTAFAAATGL
jgi:predicted PurR-regulated permease PerM